MNRWHIAGAALLVAASLPGRLYADPISFSFSGGGTSGDVQLTVGTPTDAKYPQALEVTGISGTFSDSNIGVANMAIGPLVAVTHSVPEPGNLLAPADFSRFAVASGLSPQNNGFLTYDNLYYSGGSPQTASDYPLHGGILDIYGLMFNLGDGRVVNLWSNGSPTGTGVDYGVAVANSAKAFDYVPGNVSVSASSSPSPTPEPGALALLLSGGVGMFGWRFRMRRRA